MSSSSASLQPVYDISAVCSRKGVKDAILSPGSRCAPLMLSFVRNPEINCKTISDERSAAFIALGMSLQSRKPTVLVCTSGSALYNYAPAVAEAYFQQIPLIIITADRPPEWIDQYDGQTIRQRGIYGRHVKESYTFPTDLSHSDSQWYAHRIMSEAINLAESFPKGPVHINVPVREPFYPKHNEDIKFSEDLKIIDVTPPHPQLDDTTWTELIKKWNTFNRKLIVGGQGDKDMHLTSLLEQIQKNHMVPVAGDIISNLHGIDEVIAHSDLFLEQKKRGFHESLQPDLLITFGKSLISKNLKALLRNYKPKEHWHIQEAGSPADTFKSLTHCIQTVATSFFTTLSQIDKVDSFDNQKQENYLHIWQIEERKMKRLLKDSFPLDNFGEFESINEVIHSLPDKCNLHLANSMAVRYANFIGLSKDQNEIEVYANRGTSGIDGSNSTAVGSSLNSDILNVLITGDLAFFYDRNAFWHNYNINNLRIVLLNNHAGGIFRIIDGPSELPELEEYFETNQRLAANHLAEEFGFDYLKCEGRVDLKNHLKNFFKKSKNPKILEIETESKTNKSIITEFKEAIAAME